VSSELILYSSEDGNARPDMCSYIQTVWLTQLIIQSLVALVKAKPYLHSAYGGESA
jgi:hypothetical protein